MHVSVDHCHCACPQGITNVLAYAHHTVVTSSTLCSVLPFFILQYFSHGTFCILLPTLFTHRHCRTICCPSEGLICLVGLCYIRLDIIGHSCHFVHFSTDVQYSRYCMGVWFFSFLLILSTVCGLKNSNCNGMYRHCSSSQCIKDSFSAP